METKVFDVKTKAQNVPFFYILIAFIVFLTTSDLICSYTEHLSLASICSVLSGFLVFLGSALRKKNNIEDGINEKIDYINSNFNLASVILSACDIVCSIIALFTCVVAVGVIFRWLFALRMIVIINKVKTVVRSALLVVMGYLTIRYKAIINKIKENTMFKRIWNAIKNSCKYIFVTNPKATIATLLNGAVSGITGYAVTLDGVLEVLPEYCVCGYNVVPYAVGIVFFTLLEVFGIKYAFETNATADSRKAAEKAIKVAKKQVAEEEKANETATKQAEKEAAKAQKDAEKQAKAEAKAAEKQAKIDAEEAAKAAYQAKVDAIKAELLKKASAVENQDGAAE